MMPTTITAVAPAKAILFGEHAINRGQPAIACSVGLYARCRAEQTAGATYHFSSGAQEQRVTREDILQLAQEVEAIREAQDYEAIRALTRTDYFASAKYILATAFGEALPHTLSIRWDSQIPSSSGLGSGGAAFTALVAALASFFDKSPDIEQRAAWAHRGDILAHGGIASALDTQTSLFGGVIRYTGQGLAEPLPFASGLSLVIGDTKMVAATSEVNGRVREWLAERATSRMAYFEAIGALSHAALPLLEIGNWPELGRLFTLNQLVLEKIGVSSAEIDALIDAALHAGAWGAKLSGSGGGGIIIALAPPERCEAIAEAITQAGGHTIIPQVGVPGVQLLSDEELDLE
ncbi:MAG: mevalonate kinase [Abitibacteriaceae bacterium]|nr:mevalonate kinase [Abditibacteriaceae bacterium]